MSKGGVYKMNEKGERVLVAKPTRSISSPEHVANKPVKAKRMKGGRAARLAAKTINQVPAAAGDGKPGRQR